MLLMLQLGSVEADSGIPAWVRGIGLSPQERAFKAGHFTALLTHLAGTKGGWESGTPLSANLLRTFSSCPKLTDQPPALTIRQPPTKNLPCLSRCYATHMVHVCARVKSVLAMRTN